MSGNGYRHIEALLERYQTLREAIQSRLQEFAAVPPSDYLYELIYCMLTPQSSAVHASRALEALKAEHALHDERIITDVLARREHYIRFHRTKARHIVAVMRQFDQIAAVLNNGTDAFERRRWLVQHVKGVGWKEASHFLRNVGHRDLAILDRHILKNLQRHGVIRSLPKTLTAKRYLAIEQRFRRFAQTLGVSMDEVDLLFWSNETGQILK
ncbi:MAG: DNA lyase [Ignavibacteria bacterium]